jgi:hypothetical protein
LRFYPLARAISSADKKAIELSSTPIAEDASWTTYVHNAKGDYVYPTRVQVEGNRAQVRNPEGILKAHSMADLSESETTTITTSGGGSARIIVDLGKVACGFVELGVVSASGSPIRLSYAEYLPRWANGATATRERRVGSSRTETPAGPTTTRRAGGRVPAADPYAAQDIHGFDQSRHPRIAAVHSRHAGRRGDRDAGLRADTADKL